MPNIQPEYLLDSKIGKIAILKINETTPVEYRWLFADECYWIKKQLAYFIQTKVGYKKIKLANGYFQSSGDYVFENQNPGNDCEYFAVISPDVSTYRIRYFTQVTEVIKKRDFLLTKAGVVLKVSTNAKIPFGFRKMTLEEGKQNKQELYPMVDYWSIIAFETGQIQGYGYGLCIKDELSSGCGEMFIISN